MSKAIRIPNGIICLVKTDFVCPCCSKQYTEDDYFERLRNSKNGYIHKKCKVCGIRMGISYNITGDTVVWDATPKPKKKRL